ncbi:MAG: hypothetical protein JXB10_11515 [Pirellulales bacterium]|nr:hypothetical protein [Pirellulales bacterium]
MTFREVNSSTGGQDVAARAAVEGQNSLRAFPTTLPRAPTESVAITLWNPDNPCRQSKVWTPPQALLPGEPAALLAVKPETSVPGSSSLKVRPAAMVSPPATLPETIDMIPVSNRLFKDEGQTAGGDAPPMPPPLGGASPSSSPQPAPPSSTEKLGEEPPSYNLEFLRQQTVLLKPCQWQLDVGISYLYDNHPYPALTPLAELADARIRQRMLTVPLELRYGLFENVQLFANAPLGWTNQEISYLGADEFSNDGGIGDTNLGVSILLHKSCGVSCSPDVIATLGITAPTGPGNALLGLFETPGATFGQGYWTANWSFLFIHQYDPVIMFYGFGGRHFFTRQIDDVDAKPGDQYVYQMGFGFAVNERITLSTAFVGYYVTEARLAGAVLPGTIIEPMFLRCAATIMRPNRRILEPYVEFGLTDDAPDAHVGVTWTF